MTSKFDPEKTQRIPPELLERLRDRQKPESQKEIMGEFPKAKMIYVIAGDFHAANLYSIWYRRNIENNPEIIFRYIRDEQDLRGRTEMEIHLVTTCLDHPRYDQIMDYIKELVASGRATVKEVEW